MPRWTQRHRNAGAIPKDTADAQTTIPAQAVAYINRLFEIEKNLEVLSPSGKKEQRLTQEKPVLDAFWSWAETASAGILPKSKLGEAFTYAFNQKEGLMNYLPRVFKEAYGITPEEYSKRQI